MALWRHSKYAVAFWVVFYHFQVGLYKTDRRKLFLALHIFSEPCMHVFFFHFLSVKGQSALISQIPKDCHWLRLSNSLRKKKSLEQFTEISKENNTCKVLQWTPQHEYSCYF